MNAQCVAVEQWEAHTFIYFVKANICNQPPGAHTN